MKAILTLTLCAAAFTLAACATSSATPDSAAVTKDPLAEVAPVEQQSVTGSRLPRRSSDRMIKTVGAQDARDAMTAQPREMRSE